MEQARNSCLLSGQQITVLNVAHSFVLVTLLTLNISRKLSGLKQPFVTFMESIGRHLDWAQWEWFVSAPRYLILKGLKAGGQNHQKAHLLTFNASCQLGT